jgi:hypothetical protein
MEGSVASYRYRITVRGGLGDASREAFEGFAIVSDSTETTLIQDLDQAALYGALNRIQSLGLELIALTRLVDGGVLPHRTATPDGGIGLLSRAAPA